MEIRKSPDPHDLLVELLSLHCGACPNRAGRGSAVLLDEPTGWIAFFCTDPSASVADILTTVADRFSLEITFRDCQEVVGADLQQVQFLWSNIGAFPICLWTFTRTEAWAWGRTADKRRAWRREMLGEEFRAVLRPGVTEAEIPAAAERRLSLAA